MKDEGKKDQKDLVKVAGSNLARYGSALGGLIGGAFLLKLVPRIGPPLVQKTLPGLAAMVVAYFVGQKFSNKNVQVAALGLGLTGFIDIANKFTEGQTGPLATINQNLPKLNGLGRIGIVQNTGDYPPDYFMNTQRAYSRPLSGVNDSAYQLEGPSGGYQLEGSGWMGW